MLYDNCKLGETYGIVVALQDANGRAVELDGDWQVACAIRDADGGGNVVFEPEFTIAGGIATADIDTGEEPWAVSTYWYDVRITDPDGHDYWGDTVELRLTTRQTPPSA